MLQQSLPTPPNAPAPPTLVDLGGGGRVTSRTVSPVAQYEAALAQREELVHQLEALQRQRNHITGELSNSETRGADRTGLEARLVSVDARIAAMDKQMAAADERVATAAAVPNAVSGHQFQQQEHDRWEREHSGPPEEAFVIGALFIVVAILPLSIAFARRIWRRGATVVSALPAELMERLSRLEQGMESIAIEVERIGEGQRFVTRVLTENGARAVGAGLAEPVRVPLRESVPVATDDSQR